MCNGYAVYYVPRGYSHREVRVACGTTDPYGDRAVCDDCLNNAAEMAKIDAAEEIIAADNAASRAAGWGDW